MDVTLQLLLILLISPLLIFVLHVLASHTVRWLRLSFSPQLVVMACIVLGNIPMGLILWFAVLHQLTNTPTALFWAIIYSLLFYNASGHVYFHLFNMSETALRLRIMREIATKPMAIKDLAVRYTRQASIEIRLQRLLALGQVKQQDERYLLKPNWLYIVALISWTWGRLLGFDEGDNGYPRPKILFGKKPAVISIIGLIFPGSLFLYTLFLIFIWDINLAGIQEESFGYRYFYSLRWIYTPEEFIWLPQGQLAGVFHHFYNLLLSALGYSTFDPNMFYQRAWGFVYISVAGIGLLTLVALYFLFRQLQNFWLMVLLGVIWLYPLYGWGAVVTVPDYHPFIPVLAIFATGLAVYIVHQRTPPSWKLCLLIGTFSGVAISLKFTMGAVAIALTLLLLLCRRWHRQMPIKLIALVTITIAVIFLIFLGQYLRGSIYLPQILTSIITFSRSPGGGVPTQRPDNYFEFISWAWQSSDPVLNFLPLLPLVPLAIVLTRSRIGLKLAIAFLPGCLAYTLMLYLRTAGATMLEGLAFAFLIISVLLVIWWPQQSRLNNFSIQLGKQFRLSLGALFIFGGISLSFYAYYIYFSKITGHLAQQLIYSNEVKNIWDLTNSLAGQSLFLIPDNMHRIESLDSAIFKGGAEIFSGEYNSQLMRQLFPNRDYVAAHGPRAQKINFNDYDYLIYNYTVDHYLGWQQAGYDKWSTASYRQILEEYYNQDLSAWRVVRDMPINRSGTRLLVFAKPTIEKLPQTEELTAFYLSETGPNLQIGSLVSLTPTTQITLKNGDLVFIESTLLKITPSGLVEQTGTQGQRVRLVNIGAWDQTLQRYEGLDAVYLLDHWFIDTDEFKPINDNPYFKVGSKIDSIPGYRITGPIGTYKITLIENDTETIARIEAMADVEKLAIVLDYSFEQLESAPITIVGQIRASGAGAQILEAYDISPSSRFYPARHPATNQWTTLMLSIENIRQPNESNNEIKLGLSPMKKGDWFEVRELALYKGRFPDQDRFQTLTKPEFLPEKLKITARYLPDSSNQLKVGLPIIARSGITSSLKASDIVLTNNQLYRVEIEKVVPLLGRDGQTIHVENLGLWDIEGQNYSGLPAIFENGDWVIDTSSMKPVVNFEFNSTAEINSLWISPGDATYEIISMRDESGPFIRIRATQDSSYLVITGQKPLPSLDNTPVSIVAQIRAEKPQILTLFDLVGPEESRTYVTNSYVNGHWNTITLSETMVWPDSSANYGVGLSEVKAGDWFDIRQLAVYIGRLP